MQCRHPLLYPQYSLPRQCSCQHVSGGVRISWCLLSHGHPLLGHGWRSSSCHWSWGSYHGHFRWGSEKAFSDAFYFPELMDSPEEVGHRMIEVWGKLQCCWWSLLSSAKLWQWLIFWNTQHRSITFIHFLFLLILLLICLIWYNQLLGLSVMLYIWAPRVINSFFTLTYFLFFFHDHLVTSFIPAIVTKNNPNLKKKRTENEKQKRILCLSTKHLKRNKTLEKL